MRISEPDLILPALFIISENPRIPTGVLIQELNQMLKPTGEDAEILKGRSDTKFSQIVRNLVSHEKLKNLGFATYSRGESRQSGGVFHITEKGQVYLDENIEIVDKLLLHGFPYDSVVETMRKIEVGKSTGKQLELIDENIEIQEGRKRKTQSTTYERSTAVRKAAVEYYRREDGHIVCAICDFNFYEVYGDRGKDFIEIHHETPLYETNGEERTVFLSEAVKNVKPVCSNCHRIIHRKRNEISTISEMKFLFGK